MQNFHAPLLRMQGVRKRFGATLALDGVDLAVDGGEVLALVGENGAGKSTLMKVLSGAYQADSGEMWLEGEPYRPRNPLEARRAGVAMIYQELSLAPHLSVAENILLGLEPRRGLLLDWKVMRRQAAEAMAQVGHPDIPLDMPVARLSVADRPAASRAKTSPACLPWCAGSRSRGTRSSTSPIFSKRSRRSPTATPCCATAAASAAERRPRPRRIRSSP